MANILGDEKRQQILALGRLGWPLRRIEQATGVRRETASAYLKAAGIAIRANAPNRLFLQQTPETVLAMEKLLDLSGDERFASLFIADPFVQEVKDSVVVGQFPTVGTPEHFGMTFVRGNPLVGCVNQALAELKSDGTLQAITTKWLSEKTNVGAVPVFSTS